MNDAAFLKQWKQLQTGKQDIALRSDDMRRINEQDVVFAQPAEQGSTERFRLLADDCRVGILQPGRLIRFDAAQVAAESAVLLAVCPHGRFNSHPVANLTKLLSKWWHK